MDYSKLVVYHTKRNLGSSLFVSALHPDVATGMDAVLKFLEEQGATLVDFEDEDENVKGMFSGLNAFRVWSSLMSKHRHQPFSVTIREGLDYEKPRKESDGNGREGEHEREAQQMSFFAAFFELLKSLVDLSYNTFPAMLLAFVEFISDLPIMEKENRKQCAEGLRLKEELEYLLSPEYKYDDAGEDSVRKSIDNIKSETVNDVESLDSGVDGCNKEGISESIQKLPRSKVLSREHILLLPSLPTPAPFHSESILRVFDASNTAFFNVMELPVTAVPLGLTKPRNSNYGSRLARRQRGPKRGQLSSAACNLPVGMQIVGGPNRDHVSIFCLLLLFK